MPSTPVRTVSARWIAIIGALVLSAFGSVNAAAQSELHPYSFVVQVEGRALGTFRKVDGLSVETEVIEFREGGSNRTRFAQRVKYLSGFYTCRQCFVIAPLPYTYYPELAFGGCYMPLVTQMLCKPDDLLVDESCLIQSS